ncbi:hypothetical protein L596_013489 [Steinernema carpocapsae]|uniref:Uncharacterized protein n=1 Tax=Steinernema carpocapsae TaxID=34508 RepID=A0A4V6A555_STECR|nr:hypothetical protein L596_013489 [Steinernema carpocapsae]
MSLLQCETVPRRRGQVEFPENSIWMQVEICQVNCPFALEWDRNRKRETRTEEEEGRNKFYAFFYYFMMIMTAFHPATTTWWDNAYVTPPMLKNTLTKTSVYLFNNTRNDDFKLYFAGLIHWCTYTSVQVLDVQEFSF